MESKGGSTTHFGFKEVSTGEKAGLVRDVFDSVATRYDLMNDLMSFGLHRLWKRYFLATAQLQPGDRVLDLAGGTGDVAALALSRIGDNGEVVLADINQSMLRVGRDRLTDRGLVNGLHYAQVNAEALPFADNYFDCVTIAFGLRNVTHKDRALRSMQRVLKPGGKILILEFSQVTAPLRPVYDLFSFKVLPRLGELVTKDRESYQYLAESIRKHPGQQALKSMLEEAGFVAVDYRNLTFGVVAIHSGVKP